jgi:hypothetical protein
VLVESSEAVDQIRTILDRLIVERRQLRAAGDAPALEANRLALVYWQQALVRAGGGRHRR